MKRAATRDSKYFFIFLVNLAVFTAGCEKTKIQFGEAYVDNSYSNIILVDTLTAQLSTLYIDSVVTSGSGTLLTGFYTDDAFGKIIAKSFFELAPPAITDLPTDATFDSLELIIRPNKSYYGDTTYASLLAVNQLTDDLSFPLYQTQFYNNTDFAVNPTPLGTKNIQISPNITDSISIRLADNKGKELFDLYKANDYAMQSTTNFLSYFKGLQLSPLVGGMHAVYGFGDSAVMRLHYHTTSVFTESKYLDFTFYNGDNKQFNQVKADRSGAPVSIFNSSNKQMLSTATNNRAYLQYLTGFIPKIQFPTVRNLLLRPDYVKILKAELVIQPVQNSYNTKMPLPPELYATSTDQSNAFGSSLANSSSTSYQTGNLIIDQVYGENTSYTYDVTSYLQQQILVSANNENGLLLIPPSPQSIATLNRIIIGDQKNKAGSIQLKLYYVSVNP